MSATAFIALLPCDILTQAEGYVAPQRIRVRGRDVVLYWPFWHEPQPERQLPVVRNAAIPSRSSRPFFRVPPLEIRLSVVPPVGHSFANGLRIDLFGAADEDFVTSVAADMLRQFRVRTNQWWIGHSHREGEGVLRASYQIDEEGTLVGTDCTAAAVLEPRLRIEHPLTPSDFSASCASMAAGVAVPAHWDLLFDAMYFSVHRQDWRRSLLDAAIACDLGVIYESIRAGMVVGKPEELVRHILTDRDLLANLRRGLPGLFGPTANFQSAKPDDYELVRRLWSIRGLIAHGQLPTTGVLRSESMPSGAEAAELIQAATRLLAWLADLPHGSSDAS